MPHISTLKVISYSRYKSNILGKLYENLKYQMDIIPEIPWTVILPELSLIASKIFLCPSYWELGPSIRYSLAMVATNWPRPLLVSHSSDFYSGGFSTSNHAITITVNTRKKLTNKIVPVLPVILVWIFKKSL